MLRLACDLGLGAGRVRGDHPVCALLGRQIERQGIVQLGCLVHTQEERLRLLVRTLAQRLIIGERRVEGALDRREDVDGHAGLAGLHRTPVHKQLELELPPLHLKLRELEQVVGLDIFERLGEGRGVQPQLVLALTHLVLKRALLGTQKLVGIAHLLGIARLNQAEQFGHNPIREGVEVFVEAGDQGTGQVFGRAGDMRRLTKQVQRNRDGGGEHRGRRHLIGDAVEVGLRLDRHIGHKLRVEINHVQQAPDRRMQQVRRVKDRALNHRDHRAGRAGQRIAAPGGLGDPLDHIGDDIDHPGQVGVAGGEQRLRRHGIDPCGALQAAEIGDVAGARHKAGGELRPPRRILLEQPCLDDVAHIVVAQLDLLRKALVNLRVLLLLHTGLKRLNVAVGRDRNPEPPLAQDCRRLDECLHLHDPLVTVTARHPLADLIELEQ